MAPARDESRCARPHGRARHIGMAAGKSGRAHRGMFPGNRRRDAAGDLSVHCQQSRRGGAGQAPHCRRHYRPPAATTGDGRAFRRCARARTLGRRICPSRRPRPAAARAPRETHYRGSATNRIGARSRRRSCGSAQRCVAPHRCLAMRPERPLHQRRPAYLRPRASCDGRCAMAGQRRGRARRLAPGPAGSPERGRRDVLPTGRNLFTADPRTLPTPTAMDFGRLACEEIIRAHLQAHGESLRSAVIDLWGSATLRTGGEEIAQGFALMGCRPIWDPASGRVTGIEVLPPAAIGRPRVDVTWRISGLFRDLFPAQIALIDAATQAVAAREESDEENPLAAARRDTPAARFDRIFSNAPGAYGSGVEDLLARDTNNEDIAAAYLAAASHSYGGAEGAGSVAPGAFARRIAAAEILIHPSDDPSRDLLEGAEGVAFVGGFAAAAKMFGRSADLVMLDLTDPQRPRARTLSAALARIVRARAINPRFIAGQMRHGPRGAAELAETLDRLADFADITDAVASNLFDLLFDAYVADATVRAFLLRENPQAAASIAARFERALRRDHWHPRRNDVDTVLAALSLEPAA